MDEIMLLVRTLHDLACSVVLAIVLIQMMRRKP